MRGETDVRYTIYCSFDADEPLSMCLLSIVEASDRL